MSFQTCMSGVCQCSMGTSPSTFVVLPTHKAMSCELPAANILDHVPFLNILPFGMCGIFAYLVPCAPATPSPWAPGSPTVLLDGQPTLNKDSLLNCALGGVISFVWQGQPTVLVP